MKVWVNKINEWEYIWIIRLENDSSNLNIANDLTIFNWDLYKILTISNSIDALDDLSNTLLKFENKLLAIIKEEKKSKWGLYKNVKYKILEIL